MVSIPCMRLARCSAFFATKDILPSRWRVVDTLLDLRQVLADEVAQSMTGRRFQKKLTA
jgi:hypothetical protein